jgi:hypothetical protein
MNALAIHYSPKLADTEVGKAFAMFNGANKRGVYWRVATAVRLLVKAALRKDQATKHKTARSFRPPAKPTGYWGRARVTYGADAEGAQVHVAAPGITRAFKDLEIHAKGKLLTIPARPSPEAYGKRARELSEKLFFIRTASGVRMLATPTKETEGGKPYIAKPHIVEPDAPRRAKRPKRVKENSKIRPVYWLRESVHIKQDRSILPSDRAIERAATKEVQVAVRDFVLGRK